MKVAFIAYFVFSVFVSAGAYAEDPKKDLDQAWATGLLWPLGLGVMLGHTLFREDHKA